MSDKNNLAVVEAAPKSPALASEFSGSAIQALQKQRHDLKEFIRSCLNEGTDFSIIPGTKNPSLLKPGAEKLANLFKLSMRIDSCEKEIDLDKKWAMFTYRVSLVHMPSGNVVAQCEGSTNSQEKKYFRQNTADILNTLAKMAQKRAYVGAVIVATGASDFFTQDMEDSDPAPYQKPAAKENSHPIVTKAQNELTTDPVETPISHYANYVIKFGKHKNKKFKDMPIEELSGFAKWLEGNAKKPFDDRVSEFLDAYKVYSKADDDIRW